MDECGVKLMVGRKQLQEVSTLGQLAYIEAGFSLHYLMQ